MAGSAKNVSGCQLSSSGSSEPIAYCAFLTDIFISLLPRTVLKGTDFDLTYQRLFKQTNKSVRATGAPEVKATNCIQERSEERDINVILSPGVTSARQKISDFFHDEKAASIIMNLHYAASYSRYLL